MRVLLVFGILAASACSQSGDHSDLSTSWHDQRGTDVTVLQAWIGQYVGLQGGIPGAGNLDPNRCPVLQVDNIHYPPARPVLRFHADCSQQVEEELAFGAGLTSPLISHARHIYEQDEEGQQRTSVSGRCEMIEVRTLTRDSALSSPTFHGIGFHMTGSLEAYKPFAFVPKDRLHAVGNVILKDGSPATVHRFIAQGLCFQQGGIGGSSQRREYRFRPFAEFKVVSDAGDHFYRLWDGVEDDYRLGRDNEALGFVFTYNFDRQDELLRN